MDCMLVLGVVLNSLAACVVESLNEPYILYTPLLQLLDNYCCMVFIGQCLVFWCQWPCKWPY